MATPFEDFMAQLQQQQAGLRAMPGDRLVPGTTPGGASTPFQDAGGASTTLRTATATPAAPSVVSLPNSILGNGQTYTPTDWTQAAFQQAYNQNNANGIAVPPSNFARWSTYNPTVAINRTVPALGSTGLATGGAQLGGTGGILTGNGGLSNAGGGISTGGAQGGGQVPGIPGATVSHSDPGSLTPAGYNSGFPAGGIGSPTAPITGTYNNANSTLGYLQNNYGNANQSNGNYTLKGFRFSDAMAQASPAAAQFNKLMNAGDISTAYSMLATGNQAGTQLLKSALQGDPQFMGQIINTFAKGGTNAYFGKDVVGNYYAPLVGGQFDAQGNWVNGDPALQALQMQYENGTLSRSDYNSAMRHAQNAAAKASGILGGGGNG